MNISIIGSGYVGLTTGVCFASKKHNVICLDIDAKKVDMINSGNSPIYEEGMNDLLKQVLEKGFLKATTNEKNALENAEFIFLCVGTPSSENGSINLDYIKSACETVKKYLKDYKVVVVKSTVIPGTTVNLVKPLLDKSGAEYGLCMNPEFLKEGSAIKDFLNGDRIVLGVDSKKCEKKIRGLYADFPQKIFVTNPTTAEMIKYANNSLLATKISFANELGNVCKALNIDSYNVMDGVGLDKRLCRSFLDSGAGFGGSCFPKDVKAIIRKGEELGEPMILLKSVMKVNDAQPYKMITLLKKHLNPEGKKIGVLGLAFKKGTDDVRDAPSIKVINELLNLKAEVYAYDPKAMSNAKKIYGNRIKLVKNKEELISNSDAVLIMTDWDEFKKPGLFKSKIVIAGRKIATDSETYEGLCW